MDTPKKTRYGKLVDTVLGTVMAALVLGFFALLWTGFNQLTVQMASQQASIRELNAKVSVTGEVTAEEVAKLRTGLRRLEDTLLDRRPVEDLEERDAPDEDMPRSALHIQRALEREIFDRVAEKK